MFYLGILVSSIAESFSYATAANQQGQTPDTATASDDASANRNQGNFDSQPVHETPPAPIFTCGHRPDSQSEPPQTLTLGERTVSTRSVDGTIAGTPGSEKTGHDATASASALASTDALPNDPPSPEETTPEETTPEETTPEETTPEETTPEKTTETADTAIESLSLPGELPPAEETTEDAEVTLDSLPLPGAPPQHEIIEAGASINSMALPAVAPESDIPAHVDTAGMGNESMWANDPQVQADDNGFPLPSAPPPYPGPGICYYPYPQLPLYSQLNLHLRTIEASNATDTIAPMTTIPWPEANEMTGQPGMDEFERASALSIRAEKPISPEKFNDTYYHACLNGDLDTILCLKQDYPQFMIDPLKAPSDSSKSFHPLYLAAENNHVAILEFLCQQQGIDLNACTAKNTALHRAIMKKHQEAIIFLCGQPGIDVNLVNSYGNTPIISACLKNLDDQVIDALLAHKPHLGQNKQGKTALSYSVQNNNQRVTEKLLNAGAAVDTVYSDGKDTVFYIAFEHASDQISKLLLDHLPDVNKPISGSHARVLHLAALTGKSNIITYLIENLNADKFIENKFNSKPVHYAAFDNHASALRTLIDHKCTVHENPGRIEKDFWKMKEKSDDIIYKRPNKMDGRKLYREGGTPMDFYGGDQWQIIEYERVHGNPTREGRRKEKEEVKKQIKKIGGTSKRKQELNNKEKKLRDKEIKLEKQRQKLPAAKTRKNSGASAVTDATTSVTGAYTPMTTIATCWNAENSDNIDGASALLMAASLNRKEFNKTYFNACVAGDLDTIRRLQQAHPQSMIDSLQELDNPDTLFHPLHLAVAHDQLAVLRFLSELEGININSPTSEGYTPLHLAIIKKNQDAIIFLCQQPGIDVNRSDYIEGFTPIISACKSDLNDQVIEALLALDPDYKANIKEETALYFSAKNNNLSTTEKLLNAGATVGMIVKDGTKSVFYSAFTNASDEISTLLLRQLPDVDQKITEKGACAIHLAALTGKHTLIPYLIGDLEASKFIENKEHSKPVHYAAYGNNTETLRTLLEWGCTLKEGPGKIEDEFWPKKVTKFRILFGEETYIDIDYTRLNKTNGITLHNHGGTPGEYYGENEDQLKNHEALQRKDIKREKENEKKRIKRKKAENKKTKDLEKKGQELERQLQKLRKEKQKLSGY